MHEIKFRIWLWNKKMIYFPEITKKWISDNDGTSEHCINLNGILHKLEMGKSNGYIPQHIVSQYCKEDYILMQFIGLKDVNGKEIYEGDICDCVGGESAQGFHEFQDRGKVVFKDCCFGIENEKDDVFLPFFHLIEQGFEIFNCGSTYENLGLLEASD